MQIIKEKVAYYQGEDIFKYKIIAANGFQVDVLNYGAVITAIYAPNQLDVFENVVLHYTNIEDYFINPAYLGSIVGRFAGRIKDATFTLDGKQYILAKNHGLHSLHGGTTSLTRRVWQVITLDRGIKLIYVSEDLEDGFPSRVRFEVYYEITATNELSLRYYAYPSCKTVVNLTNHTYFNLSGNLAPITNHKLQLSSSHFCPIDKDGLPTGEITQVAGTPFDFLLSKAINQDITKPDAQLKLGNGYDHPFLLDVKAKYAAHLTDPISGRCLELTTNEPCLVLYTCNGDSDININNGFKLTRHAGICLETQRVPNAINIPKWQAQVIVTSDLPYSSINTWKFS
jgi:aldose 1-epimerase